METNVAMQAGQQQSAQKARRHSRYDKVWRSLVWILLLAGSAVMILPFLWLLTSSLKTETSVFQFPPQWIPSPVMWSNYPEAWAARPWPVFLRNTLWILLINEIGILFSASLCAYGFARINFTGKNFWFAILLATMMLPGVVLMIPTFVMFSRLRWVDTFLPLTVPAFFGGGAFNIFLLRQFFRSLPSELADAARIDGCSEFDIFSRIMLPLAKPALATIAVFTFLGVWNDFMGPLLYLSKSPEKFPISLGLATFRNSTFYFRTRWDLLMAASTATIIPVILTFFLAQRFFVQGIATTGLKG
jgi:ABC-type glycerol-3-phosphate transport system permease component